MTAAEFKIALREAGFGVAQGWIVDVSGKCPGFATLPSFNKGVLNRNATLSKAIWARRRDRSAGGRDIAGRLTSAGNGTRWRDPSSFRHKRATGLLNDDPLPWWRGGRWAPNGMPLSMSDGVGRIACRRQTAAVGHWG
jgi:hypothetical protein